jgi:hypothetical protein
VCAKFEVTRLAVGGGGELDVETFTVTDCVAAAEPLFVQDRLNAVVCVMGAVVSLPDAAFDPVQPPEAVQDVPFELQVSSALWFGAIIAVFVVNVSVGAGPGAGGGEGDGGAGVLLAPPPPPQAASKREAMEGRVEVSRRMLVMSEYLSPTVYSQHAPARSIQPRIRFSRALFPTRSSLNEV